MTARCRHPGCPWTGTYPDETTALHGLESHYHVNHERRGE
jgi:hypothetical protein